MFDILAPLDFCNGIMCSHGYQDLVYVRQRHITHKNLVPISQNSTVCHSVPIDEGEDCGSRFVASPGWFGTCAKNDHTNSVLPGMAMGLMGKSMFQVKLSGTSCSLEFIASSQEISFPV